jgi:serine phosphatase RsbU (regulator of sigma subunit)
MKVVETNPRRWLGVFAKGEGHLPDEVLLLSEARAVQLYLDEYNSRRVVQALLFLLAVVVTYATVFAFSGSPIRALVAAGAIVTDGVLIWAVQRQRITGDIRQIAAMVLVGHQVVLQVFHPDGSDAGVWFVIVPLLAARLRQKRSEVIALFGALYGLVVVRLVAESLVRRESIPVADLLGYFFFVYLPLAGAALWLSHRRSTRFVARWKSESHRQRDRLRMKEELEYAREIQLSMLPRSAPDVGWLDMAALSLPASEVGGDYYDYFQLDDDRLAVVVGDVTGHGVASGLVLSGVRASLNLLAGEFEDPAAVLGRLNLMLKRTAPRRMHMTLGVAVFDRRRCEVTVGLAGHPPALVVRAEDQAVRQVGRPSVPLGALERAVFEAETVSLEPGDRVVLFSDGLVETEDPGEDQYGWERLEAFLGGIDGDGSAKAVRDGLLQDLWEHKGDAEQVDDVTMVVIECIEAAPARDGGAGI